MGRNFGLSFRILIFTFFILHGCGHSKPVDFAPGEFACEFCKMNIVDIRFKSEILSPKGKIHHFDSIECMLEWSKQNPVEVKTRWVTDFYRPAQWIALEKAFLLKSDRLPSPMGAYLSAYSSQEDLDRAKIEFGGEKTETLDVCPSCKWNSIKQALSDAKPHDTIRVGPGNYAEGLLLIDKPIHLIRVDYPIIDGLHKEHVFYVRANDVTIDGFQIQNSGTSFISEYAGIRVEESKNCRILNNHFVNNTYSIYFAKGEGCLIENNIAEGNTKTEVSGGNGIHLWYSSHITIKNNLLKKHRDGLYLEFTTDSILTGNTSTENIRYGLHFMYSHRNQYFQNTFSNNQSGVAVMYSKGIRMKENRFEKSWGRASYGLLLKDISDSIIERNIFSGNTVGIYADEASRNQFLKNNFSNNGWAINILASSEDNVFTENNFIANYFDVATNSQSSMNTFKDNYWGNYQGYDLNRDGLGDVPFRPMKISSIWINRYPELVVLLASPVIKFLEVAERVFPVLTPKTLEDKTPSMKPFALNN